MDRECHESKGRQALEILIDECEGFQVIERLIDGEGPSGETLDEDCCAIAEEILAMSTIRR